MKLSWLTLTAFCLGVIVIPVRAQIPPGGGGDFGEPGVPGSGARKTYENIEVFRLLLHRALLRHYGVHNITRVVKDAHHDIARAEGVYLKGHGVVFTFTAPMLSREDPVAAPDSTPAKQETAWERARRELRGEKADDKEKKDDVRGDTLSEVVLKLLAENGKHFTQLAPDEKLTVAVTFRGTSACTNCHANLRDTMIRKGLLELFYSPVPPGSGGSNPPPAPPPGGGSYPPGLPGEGGNYPPSGGLPPGGISPPGSGFPPGGGGQPPGTGRIPPGYGRGSGGGQPNSALLGDLHMRQEKYKEAAKEYQKALDRVKRVGADVKSLVQGAEIATKLARAHLAAGNDRAAQDALKRAGDFNNEALQTVQLKGLPTARRKKPAVPSRLIISASKRVLDQAGAGKMNLGEFRKAASVEYLDFDAKDVPAGK